MFKGGREGCVWSHQTSCGKMRMVRALRYVCVAIKVQCDASIVVGEFGGWARPLPAHWVEQALPWAQILRHGSLGSGNCGVQEGI